MSIDRVISELAQRGWEVATDADGVQRITPLERTGQDSRCKAKSPEETCEADHHISHAG